MDYKALEEIANRYTERFVFRGPETTPIRPFILAALREAVKAAVAFPRCPMCGGEGEQDQLLLSRETVESTPEGR